jgi:hypothetical protein
MPRRPPWRPCTAGRGLDPCPSATPPPGRRRGPRPPRGRRPGVPRAHGRGRGPRGAGPSRGARQYRNSPARCRGAGHPDPCAIRYSEHPIQPFNSAGNDAVAITCFRHDVSMATWPKAGNEWKTMTGRNVAHLWRSSSRCSGYRGERDGDSPRAGDVRSLRCGDGDRLHAKQHGESVLHILGLADIGSDGPSPKFWVKNLKYQFQSKP